ncbi:MAG: alanine--glyoxylate aminotransferase family protein [Candidatus Bathyarchaeota archaeon]|nr:MAG: alanine--glyoxylate aminotransferase family protein [Candidatus Bathyarchaeota archaeon]
MKLFTVGPVACYPEVLDEMKRQMFSHRSEEYKKLHRETVEMLQSFLETKNQVFLFSSTGTGFMEASVRNCVEKKMLCCVNGSFGKRFVEVAVSNGKIVETIEPPLGEPVTPALLDEKLSKCPDVEAVAITHNETSVGLINPLQELAEVVTKHGKLLFVDAVSSMGGTEIKVDEWALDVCFAGSQKCFGVPPGLSMGSVSDEALKKSEAAKKKGWYFDFKLWEKYQETAGTPVTSVIPQIAGLNKILKLIDSWGGRENYFALYEERNRRIREGIQKLGLTLFPKEGYESPTVTCINAPSNKSGLEIYKKMREKGCELAKGYGNIKDTTFRIGNMGYIKFEDIRSMLEALGEVLTDLE